MLRVLFLASLAACFCACFPSSEKLESFAPESPRSVARSLLESIRTGDMAAIEAVLHPEVDVADARQAFAPLLDAASHADTFDPEFGSSRWVYANSVARHELTYEVAIDGTPFFIAMVFREADGVPRLAGFQFQPLENSLIEANRFTLQGKSGVHYAFAVAGAAIPLFCLTTLVRCWRQRPRRRWLWLLFIAIAFPVFTLNWTTGALSFAPIAFNVLGAAFSQQSPLQPFYLQLGVPIGALVYLGYGPDVGSRSGDTPLSAPTTASSARLPER